MADTPVYPGPVSIGLSGAWQTTHYRAGMAGGIDTTVFDALSNPPASGVAAAD